MLSIAVYNEAGQQVGSEQIDEAELGGLVNARLLKQALVRYHANQRQGDACQKTRAEVEGSTRKLYKQKGTGRARRGNVRTPVLRGGGRTFPNKPTDHRKEMPRKMRRLARNQAVLAKIQAQDACIIDGVQFGEPKTKRLAALLRVVNAGDGCVLATRGVDMNLYRSGRNLQKTRVMDVAELNAWDILTRRRLVFTREAFSAFRAIAAGRTES